MNFERDSGGGRRIGATANVVIATEKKTNSISFSYSSFKGLIFDFCATQGNNFFKLTKQFLLCKE